MLKLHQQYLLLHSQLGDTTEHTLTLSDLAELLDCTHRNTLTIVKKMANLGWIHWHAQRGRARRSVLSLLVPADQIAAEYMMQTINRRELQEAADQVRAFSGSPSMQYYLNQWLLGYTGYHTEAGTSNESIDTLRLPIRQQLHALDPLYINLLAESFVTSHVYDGLVQRDEHGQILPALAHTWDVSDDSLTWTFHLRKGVHFHSGRSLSASDVVFTFERLQSTARRTLYREVSKHIHSVEAASPLTVRFQLNTPHELFLSFLTTSRAVIVPSSQSAHTAMNQSEREHMQSRQLPIGTGPFKVTLWDNHMCRLEAYPTYFQGRALIDRVDILQIPWSTSKTSHKSSQDLNTTADENIESPFFHLMHNPSNASGTGWTEASSGVSVTKLLTCNTQKPGPLNDPGVRAYLQRCIDLIQQPVSETSNTEHKTDVISEPLVGTTDLMDSFVRSPDKQEIVLNIATIPQYRLDAEQLAFALEQLGFSCTIHTGDMEQFKGDWRLESDLILFSLIQDRDEELRRYDLYATLSEHLEPFSKEMVKHMLQTVAISPLATKRKQTLDEVEGYLVSEHLMFSLSQKPVETAYLPSVRGLSFNSQGWVNLRHIWFPSKELE
ncbi:ABC transporter substrate-binding protein [Paenibacillus barcinonensis]|uniref:ABC transporter substrate-binding protein n=1 Tax=Paenibacillus barcinonensis TaxID=198119 RepID=UPI001FD2A0B1|nr:ABC transporter substrate-binding protein [Paenibacillus barcinonensis]